MEKKKNKDEKNHCVCESRVSTAESNSGEKIKKDYKKFKLKPFQSFLHAVERRRHNQPLNFTGLRPWLGKVPGSPLTIEEGHYRQHWGFSFHAGAPAQQRWRGWVTCAAFKSCRKYYDRKHINRQSGQCHRESLNWAWPWVWVDKMWWQK